MRFCVDAILQCVHSVRMNADDFKNVTVQFPPDLLAQIDEKAKRLDLNRSQYFRRLARIDLEAEASHVEQSSTQAAQPVAKAA